MLFLEKVGTVHFVGIGGISMSALAKLMLMTGRPVTGSDIVYNKQCEELTEWGAFVYQGSDPAVAARAGIVVYTQAVASDDPELEAARAAGVPIIRRDCFLGELARGYDCVIAVAGTHGKTTTTAMLVSIFYKANALFTAHIGGNAYGFGNMVYRGNRFFITEACEYKRSFLTLRPHVGIVLNVAFDHPDTYKNYDELYHAFTTFISGIPEEGVCVLNAESAYYNRHECDYKHIVSYGEGGEWTAEDLVLMVNGCYDFQITHNGIPQCRVTLKVPGLHNTKNALAAYIAATYAGIDGQSAAEGLSEFSGVERRFEFRGLVRGAEMYADYAHHPDEIAAVIATARSLSPKRLITVFQPHTFSRTEALLSEFVASFEGADSVIIVKEYAARETKGGIDAYGLYKCIAEEKKESYYFETFIPLAKYLVSELKEGDMLLVLGAGDVDGLTALLI